ncbi:hypothetical protein WR25_26864 [Diploscapter pachys]|uniref:Uncharacterized protein n=1 Tax=Diploscapter pachys TaxID=2018661 RepID=A0A2A2KTW6_9BILA|nr:hypothetical protein WR25_26864 [Diploscapter pachys]
MLQIIRTPSDDLNALLFLQAALRAVDDDEIKTTEAETDEQQPSGSQAIPPNSATSLKNAAATSHHSNHSSINTQHTPTPVRSSVDEGRVTSERSPTPEGSNENGMWESRKRRGSILRRPTGILSQNNNGESRPESPSKAKKRVRFDVPDNAPERETSPSIFRLNDAVCAAKRRRTSLIGICFPSNGDALIGGICYSKDAVLQPVA